MVGMVVGDRLPGFAQKRIDYISQQYISTRIFV